MDRLAELSSNWSDVCASVEHSCQKANRSSDDISIIVVTKTWPAQDIELLASLGVTDVGENRDQEAKIKHSALADLNLTWHAIGQLQTNKAKSVAAWADVVHSVDRPELVNALGKATRQRDTPLKVLVQVNLDPVITRERGGCDPESMLEIAHAVHEQPGLALGGVMGVAPLDGDADAAFELLQHKSRELVAFDPEASWISAGMSDDFQKAIKYGATHLRIGSLILGHRPSNR
jgi:pyridoxal phosphate enzyme (YggS family)